MIFCRVCGTDVELMWNTTRRKNRRTVSGNPFCKTLLEVAAYSLEANFSPDLKKDMSAKDALERLTGSIGLKTSTVLPALRVIM